jgi:GNAT superfamily N-acetyltransferase
MRRIRASVKENRLTSRALSEADYLQAIERDGRGWVMEVDGQVLGFAIANSVTGNIWALFVDPDHEGQGHGHRLHDSMVEWLWSQGARQLWLTTEAGTRAQRFYESAGWRFADRAENGELRYELTHIPAMLYAHPVSNGRRRSTDQLLTLSNCFSRLLSVDPHDLRCAG